MNGYTGVQMATGESARPAIPGLAAGLLLAISICSLVLVLAWEQFLPLISSSCNVLLGNLLPGGNCNSAVGKLMTHAWALAGLPLIMLLERWQPAVPSQRLFSPGLFVDALWFITFPLLGVWLPSAFQHLLAFVFGSAVAEVKVETLAGMPIWLQFGLVILFSDFLAWLSHLIRHKVPMFWEFHKIHHSQTELNYFSAKRLHPLDLLTNSLIRFLPFTLLGFDLAIPGYLVWTTILRVYEAFVHSNIRHNLGPLRYALVSPQGHRIHHSLESRHIDKNFGDFFSIWDFMFRTQCLEFDVYPKLGVHDAACPHGRARTWRGSFRMFGRELVYPLRALGLLPRGSKKNSRKSKNQESRRVLS